MRKLPLSFVALFCQLVSLLAANPPSELMPSQQQLLIRQLIQQATRVMAPAGSGASLSQPPLPAPLQVKPRQAQQKNQTLPVLPKSTGRSTSNATTSNQLLLVRQKWRSMERSVGNSLNNLAEFLKTNLNELLQNSTSVSSNCQSSLLRFTEAISGQQQQLWASQMLDASARLPAGLFEGTLTELGNFDQCLSINWQEQQIKTRAQYCTIQIKPALLPRPRLHTVCQKLPAPVVNILNQANNNNQVNLLTSFLSQHGQQFHYAGLRLGVCLPSQCSRADLQQLLSSYLAKYELVGQLKGCQIGNEGSRFDNLQQCIILTFGLILVLTLLGTLADYLLESKRKIVTNQSKLANWHQQNHIKLQKNPLQAGVLCDFRRMRTRPLPARSSSSDLEPDFLVDSLSEEAWVNDLERNSVTTEVQKQTKSKWKRDQFFLSLATFFSCFSLRRGLQEISRHARKQPNNENDDIRVIHGLRTLTMVWVIFGHSIGLVAPEMMNNLLSLAELSCSSRALQALLNATLAVNTFFMISGLVTVVSFARKCKSAANLLLARSCSNETRVEEKELARQRGKTKNQFRGNRQQVGNESVWSLDSSSVVSSASSNSSSNICLDRTQATTSGTRTKTGSGWPPSDFQPLLWLLMRYIRLTPAYAATIGLTILLPALGSGPFWQESTMQMGASCRARWWHNLLYVNNFLETDKLCLIHSWYLSNDWQFFILTLLLFGLFYRWPRIVLLLVISLIIGSSAATFAITVSHDFPPTIVTTSPAIAERWTFIHSLYYKPWPHLSSYLIGLLVGYLILVNKIKHKNKPPEQNLKKTKNSSCIRPLAWLLFGLIALSVLNSVYPWNMGLQVDPLLTGLHSATFRTLWAISIGWLVFALSSAPKNPLARFLSWHGFQVTSRLTYCAYLIHPLLIFYHFGSLRERLDSSAYGQFHRFIATLALSYLFALLLALLVESPSIQIQHFLAKLSSGNGNRKWPELEGTNSAELGESGRNCESLTTNSWTVAGSSFDMNQLAGSGSGQQVSGTDFKLLNATLQTHNNLLDCRHQQQQQQHSKGQTGNGPQLPPVGQLDAEFQRKLAQAIGRGFRIRSKLAAGTIKHTSGSHKLAGQSRCNGGGASKHRANQIKSLPRRPTSPPPLRGGNNSTKAPPVFISADRSTKQQQLAADHRAEPEELTRTAAHRRPCSLQLHNQQQQQQQEMRTFCGGSGVLPARPAPIPLPPPPPPPLPVSSAEALPTGSRCGLQLSQRQQLNYFGANRPPNRAQQTSLGDLNNLNEMILSRQRLLFRSQSQTNFKNSSQ